MKHADNLERLLQKFTARGTNRTGTRRGTEAGYDCSLWFGACSSRENEPKGSLQILNCCSETYTNKAGLSICSHMMCVCLNMKINLRLFLTCRLQRTAQYPSRTSKQPRKILQGSPPPPNSTDVSKLIPVVTHFRPTRTMAPKETK